MTVIEVDDDGLVDDYESVGLANRQCFMGLEDTLMGEKMRNVGMDIN